MINPQTCIQCGCEFDFDIDGYINLRTRKYVCSAACAKRATSEARSYYAIYDDAHNLADTDNQRLVEHVGKPIEKTLEADGYKRHADGHYFKYAEGDIYGQT